MQQTVETSIHDKLTKLFLEIYDETGMVIEKINTDWDLGLPFEGFKNVPNLSITFKKFNLGDK